MRDTKTSLLHSCADSILKEWMLLAGPRISVVALSAGHTRTAWYSAEPGRPSANLGGGRSHTPILFVPVPRSSGVLCNF